MVDALINEKGLKGESEVLLEASGDMGGAVAGMGCDGGGRDILIDMGENELFDLFEKQCLVRGRCTVCVFPKESFEQRSKCCLGLTSGECLLTDPCDDLHEFRAIVLVRNDKFSHGQ